MFKRLLLSCLAALMTVAFIGCKEEPASPPPATGPSAPAAQATYKCAGCGDTKTAGAADSAPSC